MKHYRKPLCDCQVDYAEAAQRLGEAAAVLANSVVNRPEDDAEEAFASLRAAHARLRGARAAYLDHCAGEVTRTAIPEAA